MAEGRKHVHLRSLAVLINDTTVPLEVSVVPRALREADEEEDTRAPKGSRKEEEITGPLEVEDEIFENERYMPCVGWGSSWLLPVSSCFAGTVLSLTSPFRVWFVVCWTPLHLQSAFGAGSRNGSE